MREQKIEADEEILKSVRKKRTPEELEEIIKRNPLGWARSFGEITLQAVVTNYLDSLGIPLARANGPYYLVDCYMLYALEGVEISPQMIFMVAAMYDRQGWHVRKGLQALSQKIARLDPHTARWMDRGYRFWLEMMFPYMEEKAGIFTLPEPGP